ncbi:MAG: ATP-dependent DNA helicase RecG [Thermoleophilia bacterium]
MRQRGGGIHFPFGAPASAWSEAPVLPPSSKRRQRPERLERRLDSLPGVGRVKAERLAGLGLKTVGDLLFYIPFRHEAPARLATVASLREGEETTLRVIVQSFTVRSARRRGLNVLEALIGDESASISAIWYNQAYLADVFAGRPEILVRGALRRTRGSYSFRVTSHEVVREDGREEGLHTIGLIPVYPATGDVSVRSLRTLLGVAREEAEHVADPLPSRLVARRGYPSRRDALLSAHFPRSVAEAAKSRERLAFEELLFLQVALLRHRRQEQAERPALALPPPSAIVSSFIEQLVFSPTRAQHRVMAEIDDDLGLSTPMRRLLQGDVGSGKTVVAAYALLRAVEAGGQGVVMVPTEVLADQHALRLGGQLRSLGVPVLLLKGSQPARERREVLGRIAAGEPMLVVGTQALIQKGVDLSAVRVMVIDEQHRFGVRQRAALVTPEPGSPWPHTLHMTATPIPRTLSLTLYGDLDVSVIDELPPGRTPVDTRLFDPSRREDLWEFVRKKVHEGRQAYVVCPLVEESESLQAASATATFTDLSRGDLRDLRLALIHGQMKSEQKHEVMRSFEMAYCDVLVTTTVIEVGVDVPNATVMVIEDARRFGLSQLHQLRGRVARGAETGHCLVGIDGCDEEALTRLDLFCRTTDGFKLAEADLRARGEGQVFGERQSGWGDLRVARLLRDQRLLMDARGEARRMLAADPDLDDPRHLLLAEAAMERFGGLTHWLDHA